MKENSTLFGRWINFYNIMSPNLEESEFSALYAVLESALRLIRDVLRRCNSDKHSFYISYAWELGNPESLQQRRFHAVLSLLEGILQYLSSENSVFFDISDMQGNIEQTMNHAIMEKDFAILVGSPRFVTRVTNDMRSPAAFEFFKIMQRKNSEENCRAEREYQYIYYIMLDGEFHDAFPCVPKFAFPDQENITPESFDGLVQKEKSLVSADGAVRVCFSEEPICKEMIFDARSIMEEGVDMRAIHNFLQIIFGLAKPKGMIPTCSNIGGVDFDTGIYESYGAAVELMWSAIAGVQLRAAHTKFVRFSKKINDAKNAFPYQPNICSLLDKFFDEVTSISSRCGNIYSKLTEIDLLIKKGSLDLAKKECAKSKVLARSDKEKELIEHLEKKVEGHQLMKLAASPQAGDKELEKYIRILLSADGIGRSPTHKSIALTTATVLLERVTDLKIKEQLTMSIRTIKGANLFFITSNDPWYTDREISSYLKMMIMSENIGGYATNDQGILCSYLLKGENDGMFPGGPGQDKRFYVAVLPSVDNQKEFVAVDYFWDKERQSKNLIVTFLERLLHDQRELHRLRQLPEDALSSYISDQLETEQEIEHQIDSNIIQTIRDQLVQANFNTTGVLIRIEELKRIHSACRVDVLDELLPKLEGPNSAAKILFPYRHTMARWWLGEIQLSHDENMQQNCYFVRFFAHDPYGGGTFKREHVLVFMRLFQRRIYEQNRFKAKFFVETPQSPYGRRQTQEDNESCGLILCEDLLLRIRGNELPSKISNPSELRQKHEHNRKNNNLQYQSDKGLDSGTHQAQQSGLPPKSPLNAALSQFLGVNTEESSCLQFATWYSPDTCHYLLNMVENKALCLRVVLEDFSDTTIFEHQIIQLIRLTDQLNRPVVFISKEPGSYSNNHFIVGLIKVKNILLINPLGLSKNKGFYTDLKKIQEAEIINTVWLSDTVLQRPNYEEGLVSCGPISSELALTLISDFQLNGFFDALRVKLPKTDEESGLTYEKISIKDLLSEHLRKILEAESIEHYRTRVCELRKKHGEQLGLLPPKNAEKLSISVEKYVSQCLESSPGQVVWRRLIHGENTVNDIQNLEEYIQLVRELEASTPPCRMLSSMQTSGALVAEQGLFGGRDTGGAVTAQVHSNAEQNRAG